MGFFLNVKELIRSFAFYQHWKVFAYKWPSLGWCPKNELHWVSLVWLDWPYLLREFSKQVTIYFHFLTDTHWTLPLLHALPINTYYSKPASFPSKACDGGDVGSIAGWGKYPGEGNGNRLQYFCLGSPLDRGAWWAIFHGVPKSRTWLSY